MCAPTRGAAALPLASLLLLAACGPAADELLPGLEDPEVSTIEDELALAKRAAVFSLSNDFDNAVLIFKRDRDGRLAPMGRASTGGIGSGGRLGSQGALALSPNERWMVAVNAGSDEISLFTVMGTELRMTDRVPSGGERPIGATFRSGLVYVLNAGGTGNVSGFRVDSVGRLRPIAGATRPLSGVDSDPAQVSLSADLRTLVVTERAAGSITTYAVHGDGSLGNPVAVASSGPTPSGFALTSGGTLVVAEAFDALPDQGAVSSYRVGLGPQPVLVSTSVHNLQTAPSWVVATSTGARAYASNPPAGTISGYSIDTAGRITLFPDGGHTAETGDGSMPSDLAVSHGSRFLYVLEAGVHDLGAFQVLGNGALVPIQGIGTGGLPLSAAGLVAI